MPLSGNDLGDAIMDALDIQRGIDPTDRQANFRAMGNAIVTYLKANAVITTTGTATGVTVGAGTAPTASTGSIG